VLAPIGCWIGAAAADTIGGRGSRRLARRLIGAGVLAAGPAVSSGAADWLDTRKAEQRVGTAHAILNHLALGAMGLSWILRGRGHHRAGITASSIGLGGVLAAGYLGGHLAYARGVGVSTTAFQAGPAEWTKLIERDALDDDRPVAVALDGVGLVAVAHGGDVHVLENRCTHRGGPLAEGSVSDGCIECPWHGSRFALTDGRVAAGPASVDQPAYETRVSDGSVEIRRTELGGLRSASARP
jgi:nitrite reductase/ring-hydroxylating ferredoxin subunit